MYCPARLSGRKLFLQDYKNCGGVGFMQGAGKPPGDFMETNIKTGLNFDVFQSICKNWRRKSKGIKMRREEFLFPP